MTTEIWPYPSVSALSVADVILWARRVFGLPTTNLDLNKLVYLCHGWTLGVHGKPLIADRVEAWRYGPVIPAIYHEYKLFGSDNIDIEVEEPGDLGSLFVSWIRGGVESYKEWSTAELVSLTHRDGSPWDTVTKKCLKEYGTVLYHEPIPDDIIKEFYASQAGSR